MSELVGLLAGSVPPGVYPWESDAAWLGYKWANGSNGRDDAYRLTFAVLALAGIVRYLTWAGRIMRRD